MTPKTNPAPSPLRRLIYALVLATAAGALAMGAGAPAFSQAQRQTQPPSEARRPSAPPPAAERPSTPAGEADRAAAPAAETGQPAPPTETVQQPAGRDRGGQEATRKLPADATSDHALALPGRTLRFKATSGSIPLFDGDGGKLEAEVAYIAYTVGDAVAGRPVTFVFNGGPGAASAYLNIGGLGPWRLPFDRITASGSAALVPNAETWLDFTDLVFIDPPGTGYSRLVGGDEARRSIW
ncbi:MAG TPA: hypothetical protein VFY53_06775, partial [Rhodoplanes sp.]|nr:hypothetical protein [Rhodoplanes sp.]